MCECVCKPTIFFSVFSSFYLFYSNRKCVCFECVEYWILVNRTRISLQFVICIILFRFFYYFFFTTPWLLIGVRVWTSVRVDFELRGQGNHNGCVVFVRNHSKILKNPHAVTTPKFRESSPKAANHLFIHCDSRDDDDADWVIRVCDLESFDFFLSIFLRIGELILGFFAPKLLTRIY